MSAKWRALQHRHRYTYSAIVFPNSYTYPLHHLPLETLSLPFFKELTHFVKLNSTYAQLGHSKNLAKAFSELILSNPDEEVIWVAARFYLEILVCKTWYDLAVFRALQQYHRYTYNATIFPNSYAYPLHHLPLETLSLTFFKELTQFVKLKSTYAQLGHSKNLAKAFSDLVLANPDEEVVWVAARFYLEIMFLENSVPLHKTLVSALGKSRNYENVVRGCFRVLCDEYGGNGNKGKRFCVSRVALSIMGLPKLGFLAEVVRECAVLVSLDVVYGLGCVVEETRDGSRPSPVVMEQCQDALSCVYYLLQRYPDKFVVGCSDGNVMEMILETVLDVLKSSAFTRDCYVAAGVSLCAALQVCLGPEELCLAIVECVFYESNCCLVDGSVEETNVVLEVPFKRDLYSEIRGLSTLSRLCLLRGILTAVSRTVLNTRFTVSNAVHGLDANGEISDSARTILYDEILPELCRYCENPTDSHFNFHASTVMQICLQQIKTSIQADSDNLKEDYNPISKEMGTRILSLIWNNLEDPLSQTVKQVHLIFDIFLDIQSTLHWSKCKESVKLSLQPIASDLLRLGPRCKGRYVPLASVTRRLGAKFMLDLKPNLLLETANAYIDDDVCCAVTTFLKCFLECLRDECWSSDGIESGYANYRGICLPPFLFGLASGVSKLRTNLNTYALPVLLEVDVDSIFPMLSYISVGQCEEEIKLVCHELGSTDIPLRVEQKVAILVSLLKVSRSLALLEGDIDWFEDSFASRGGENLRIAESDCYAVFRVKGINVKVLAAWLVMALTHVDESLRVDAAGCLFLNPKTASLPSHLELSVLKEAVPLNMRCCSTAFQMKWNSLFRKFFSRVKTALERQIKQGTWRPGQLLETEKVIPCNGKAGISVNRAENLFNFMKWLSSFLFFSCYPSAPYERKMMAMEMMLTMISTWPIVPTSSGPGVSPYNQAFTSPDSTLLLVGSVVDSWDRLRENSFRILLHFPTPLPGICSEDLVEKVIIWAKQLVCSPRVRESDAGALSFRLIFRKYALELGWIVRSSCNVVSSQPNLPNGDIQNCVPISPSMLYINSLIDWLQALVEEGEKDLYEACRKSFVHGALLTLRYTFEELDWNSDIESSRLSEMRLSLEKLLDLIMRITSLALGVVSADAYHLPDDMDDMVDEGFCLSEVPADADNCDELSSSHEVKNEEPVQDVSISNQIVMVGCWLAMKEVSLLLGTVIRKVPMPTSYLLENRDTDAVAAPVTASDVVLDLRQLETMGNHFLEVLLKMKHNGAVDKTRAGFSALCNRLLCSNDPILCKLTESWMEELMERTIAKGQTVDDLLRRSAGIPAAFTALFLSEPEGTPKRLLPRALRWLLDVANKSLLDLADVDTSKDVIRNNSSSNSEQASKIRDEGVVPTVHIFNVLRAAFNDTNLATDTSGFSAEALIIAIRSFSSPYWEIRNSACLAYTALVRRMVGFLNVQKRESARRAITGLEFFHRYPSVHHFLYNELRVATELLSDMPAHNHANLAKAVHPSLCPMLILLSRLKPSTIASETGDILDPFLFMPYIRRCCVQSNYKVRVLASKALTGLVSNENLPSVLLNIASELPCGENQNNMNRKSGIAYNSIHGMLLQLGSLLETNCQNLVDVVKKDQIIADLFHVLVTRSWMGRPESCPCPTVNTCFLRVLDSMLKNVTPGTSSKNTALIRKLLWELSSECLEIEASRRPFYDPTLVELCKQAAISYFSCVFPVSKEVSEEGSLVSLQNCPLPSTEYAIVPEIECGISIFQQRLVKSMSDTSYEVRVATLKWLHLFLENTQSIESKDKNKSGISIMDWIRTDLQNVLTSCLVTEKNHKCILYLLRILFSWNLLQFQKQVGQQQCDATVNYLGNMDYKLVLQFWDLLISMSKHTRHAKTRVALICCIGICMKRISDIASRSILIELMTVKKVEYGRLYDCIAFYIDLIREYSDASEPVNMRRAASESLLASGLLDQADIGFFVLDNQIETEPNKCVHMYAQKILDAWFLCVRLLEDEDDELRRLLAMDVQKCFSSGKGQISALVPSQVEKVIEFSFEHLSSKFGNWVEYINYLLRWVFDAADCVVSVGDLVRRVFDKEIDNHHEEKLLICQLCCSHLVKVCTKEAQNSEKAVMRDFLLNWRTKFRLQLISFSNDYITKQGGVDWIGSLGNHKDAFLPIYANLLSLYALSNAIFRSGEFGNEKSLLADVAELEDIIRPFLGNPMILNLYLLLVKSHEKIAGCTSHFIEKARGDESSWDGFDPYFLLK